MGWLMSLNAVCSGARVAWRKCAKTLEFAIALYSNAPSHATLQGPVESYGFYQTINHYLHDIVHYLFFPWRIITTIQSHLHNTFHNLCFLTDISVSRVQSGLYERLEASLRTHGTDA